MLHEAPRWVSRRLIAAVACVVAAVVAVVSVASAGPASGDAAAAAIVHIVDPQPDTVIGSVVDVTVTVDLGGADSGTLVVELGPVSSQIPVAAADCAGGCTTTAHLTVPNGDWDNPVESGPISLRATVTVPGAEPVSEVYGLVLDGPSRITGFAVVRNGLEYRTRPVLDGAASVLLEADERRHSDDVGQMRLVDGATLQPVAGGETPWVSDGAGYTAEIPFDVSSLADRDYLLTVRSRTATGRWGHSYQMWVRVSHVDPVSITATPPYLIVGSATVTATITVRGPIPGNFSPGAVRVTLDGVDHDLASPAWSTGDWSQPGTEQTLQFAVPGGELATGTHQVTFQVLNRSGQPLGRALARTYTVSDFSATLSVPTVQVVGQRLTGTAHAVAPTGYQLTACLVDQTVPGQPSQPLGDWCVPPLTQLATSFAFTPQAAGPGTTVLTVQAAGQTRHRSQPVTVYAARRISVTAPALPYGTRGTARITVQDAKLLNKWRAAAAGLRVTLQRLTVGTTTWATVGSATTGTGGTATVAFTGYANGRFRALVPSTLPNQTITSPTIAATSTAIVTWRHAPTTATRGVAYTYEAATRPYDPATKAYLQVRPPGVQTWSSARTITLPTTAIARFSYTFNRTGYWRVRIVRGNTPLRTGAASSIIGVWVR